MADMEKVITALEFCTDTKPVETCFGKCPYAVADDDYRCRDMKLDALTLLKEQKAVKPTWGRGKPFCGACGLQIRGGKFCSECGKPIAWEGR